MVAVYSGMTWTQNPIQTPRTATTSRSWIPCTLHAKGIGCNVDLAAVTEIVSRQDRPSILGGNPTKSNADGFTYWAAEPRDVFEFRPGHGNPFDQLQNILARYRLAGVSSETPLPTGLFRGGWIGYFGYELGRYIETLGQTTVEDIEMPLIRLAFYDRLLAYDHHAEAFWALALEMPDDTESPAQKLAAMETTLDESRSAHPIEPRAVDVEGVDFSTIRSNIAKDDYLRAIERAKRYIYDGEIYQVNLSQRFERRFTGRPIDLFHWQNRHNPSGYAAYIDTGDIQIVSASPEMFLTIENGRIRTQPIKGTRPRLGADEAANRRNFDDLLNSEKEQAELNMIVDLERNDLARICRPGTRHVTQPRTVETFPTVFHAVATVGGQLRGDVDFCEILRAVFPGGSITGAPKIRAMQIIDELEPTARGVYTGSIGFVGLDGTACLNIAIRTVIIAGQKAYVQSGGGIVADSAPEAEWEETITKARALLAGLEAVRTP